MKKLNHVSLALSYTNNFKEDSIRFELQTEHTRYKYLQVSDKKKLSILSSKLMRLRRALLHSHTWPLHMCSDFVRFPSPREDRRDFWSPGCRVFYCYFFHCKNSLQELYLRFITHLIQKVGGFHQLRPQGVECNVRAQSLPVKSLWQ